MSETIQGIYVALFGRPADPGGLAYWTDVMKNGTDLSEMLRVLPAEPEYTDRFTGLTNSEAVDSIYSALFGRIAEPEGLVFFVALLESGAQTLSTIAVHILIGAQGSDKATIDAKLAAASLFTEHLDLDSEVEAYVGDIAADIGREFISSVNGTTPATEADTDAAILRLFDTIGGQEPGGGGGGDATHPVITSPDDVGNIDENVEPGTTVYTVTATDNAGVAAYKLRGDDADAFEISAGGVVTLKDSPNFEVKSVYKFNVIAEHNAGNTASKTLTLTINDVNEAPTTSSVDLGKIIAA